MQAKLHLKGHSFLEMVDQIAALHLSGGDLQKLIGRKEAIAAYQNILSNREDFQHNLARQREAEAQDLYTKTLAFPALDPSVKAAGEARVAGEQEKMGNLAIGTERNRLESVRSIHRRHLAEGRAENMLSGFGPAAEQAGETLFYNTIGRLYTDRFYAATTMGNPFASDKEIDAYIKLNEAAGKLDAAADKMDRAASGASPTLGSPVNDK